MPYRAIKKVRAVHSVAVKTAKPHSITSTAYQRDKEPPAHKGGIVLCFEEEKLKMLLAKFTKKMEKIAEKKLPPAFKKEVEEEFKAASVMADVVVKTPSEQQQSLTLPEEAPDTYAEMRARGGKENPVEFYNRVWKEYVDAGVLYRFQLNALDPTIIPAIKSYCQSHKCSAKKILPPPKKAYTDRVIKEKFSPDADYLSDKNIRRAASRLGKSKIPKMSF